ncbi:hypothetical protein PV682_19350 [Streptomyces niveiscabiei]|uniref:hypothetical protein n=1 Tax=Streptomyces niveiscabiei TaxID=164115 RepID=UPI0029B8C4DE|nr:hypothetical protein [Streptomyces niveiscabiei]MDX3383603.1 hypothetical protein [Streptomyces niveiscabiei]
MTWSGHFHGYGPWVGTPENYHREGNRRPPHPTPPAPPAPDDKTAERTLARYREVSAEFPASNLPPMMSGHWLLKRNQTSADRTWTDPEAALEWMTKHYLDNLPLEPDDGKQMYVGLDVKREYAADVLPVGVDVSWVHYNRSGNIVSINVVCCPNRHHPDLRCPLPPS